MTDREKIKAEVEGRIEYWSKRESNEPIGQGRDTCTSRITELKDLLSFTNSLPEKPVSEDLEEASWQYYDKNRLHIPPEWELHKEFIDFFKAGAKWQKELIAYCQVNMGHTWHDIKQEDYIAYLEKQKPVETKKKVVVPKFRVGETITDDTGVYPHKKIEAIENENYVVRCLYTNQKHYIPIDTQDEYVLVKQKPVEWSVEDEKILNLIIARLHSHPGVELEEYGKLYRWLNNLIPQPKQEWSEEDEDMLETLISDYEFLSKKYRDEQNDFFVETSFAKDDIEMVDWLKSLRHQKQWKPSKEQIMYLCEAIDIAEEKEKFSVVTALKELLGQLKKLMEE